MIQLNPSCLVFQTAAGESIPCEAAVVVVEMLGPAAATLDPVVLENATAAVLHYFHDELSRNSVTVEEFAHALARALRACGLDVAIDMGAAPAPAEAAPDAFSPPSGPRIEQADLREIACASGKGCELFFFPTLRDEMRRRLEQAPQVLRFYGLRDCVKQLCAARRWNQRCQTLNDQIVDYLRTCLSTESHPDRCALVVS